jgi:cytochrome c biogenesis protein CcdA
MSLSAAFALIGLALLDALNPFSIAAQAFLLSTDRPVARGLAFVLGTFAIYLLCGVALLEGWIVVLQSLLPSLPPWVPGGLEVGAGAAALAAGVYTWRQVAQGKPTPSPSNLSVLATIAFAVVSTLSDLPTAIPYFAAASQIAASDSGAVTRYAWLFIYNLIYVAPLVAMLGLRVGLGDRTAAILRRVRTAVDWSVAKLLPPLLMLAGVALLGDGALRLVAALT